MMNLPTAPSGPPGKPLGSGPASENGNNNNGNNDRANPPPPPPPPSFGDPSKRRRDTLKKHERPPIPLSNLCPIDKYYSAADKVLATFKTHLSNMELDDAYIIGRRFALFSTVSLPKHDYYTSPKYARLRLTNQKDAQWVTRGLERIVEVMDKQEIEKERVEKERLRKEMEEEERKRLEWEESMRQRLGAGLGKKKLDDSSDGGALDMMSKLEKLNALFPPEHDGADEETSFATPSAPPPTAPSAPLDDDQLPPLPMPLPPPMAPPSLTGEQDHTSALFTSTDATQQLKSEGGTPLFGEPAAPPPSYSDLFLDTLRTSTTSVTPEELAELERLPSSPTAPKPPPRTPMRVIQRKCLEQMLAMQNSKQIEVMRLGTFQGRMSASNPRFDSTNGCAVISPLVVAAHIYPQHATNHKNQLHQKFSSATSPHTSSSSKYGIPNSAINDIIDKRAPPILQNVRSKLGLNKHALIIPSDVHDFLVDERILPQDKFVGVCGGDIMDSNHIKELITMLVNGRDDTTNSNKNAKKSKSSSCRKQKVGAALFFREHVISIVKIPLGNGVCYYDLVDSLPSSQAGGMASRTRCKDLASFEVLLRWYASSKFSETHCSFIDDNAWDDGMCDFDPRVFQGFVWGE